ncbi:MAG: hypothetical protein ABIV48_05660 [Pyrinomonadaceae bacterium]
MAPQWLYTSAIGIITAGLVRSHEYDQGRRLKKKVKPALITPTARPPTQVENITATNKSRERPDNTSIQVVKTSASPTAMVAAAK